MRKATFWCCISLLASCAFATSANYIGVFLHDGFLIISGLCIGAFAYWWWCLIEIVRKRKEVKSA